MMHRVAIFCCVLLVAATGPLCRPSAKAAGAVDPVKVVVLGDSLTAGYGLAETNAFPQLLEQVLRERGHQVDIVNAGVSGDTATGALSRLGWAVQDGTDLVIVELGANDALRGVAPRKTEASLRAIITRLKSRNIEVLLAGMRAPPNMGPDYEVEFNAIYSTLSREFDISLYPFFLDGVAANPELNLDDGIHPNEQGVAEIVNRMRPMIEAMIIDIAQNGDGAKQ